MVDPSSDTGGGEVVRCGRLLGTVRLALGRTPLAFGRRRDLTRTRYQPLANGRPRRPLLEHDRLDHAEVGGPVEPGAVAFLLGGKEEAAGVGAADLPTADGGGLVGSEDPLAGLGR